MILTVRNYSEFQRLNLSEDFPSEVAMVSILSGIPDNDIPTEDYDDIKMELMQQAVASEPVYLVRWKGKVYGYYPADLETIGEVVEFSSLTKSKKWNLLTAFTFREVTWMSKKVHRTGWKKFHGIDVKFINNFKTNYSTYAVKKVKDWRKMDLDIWDDFPFEILSSNINFLVGNGLNLSLNIKAFSKEMHQVQVEMQRKLQTLTVCMVSYLIFQKKNQSSQEPSDTNQSQTSPQSSSLSFLQDVNIIKQIEAIADDAYTLTGKFLKAEVNGYIHYVYNLFSPEQMQGDIVKLHSLISKTVRHG